jgi:hypothetical protein
MATDYKTLRERDRERVRGRETERERRREIFLYGGTIQFLTVFR